MKKGTLAAACVCGLGLMLALRLPAVAADGDAKKGESVFSDNCGVCHNADSTDAKVGPGLKGLFKRAKLVNDKPVSEENVRTLINEGTSAMPPMGDGMKADEKDNLIAYLKSL